MWHRLVGFSVGAILAASALVVSVLPPGSPVGPLAAKVAAAEQGSLPPGCVPEVDHASIRLDMPPSGGEVAVDEQGKIGLGGIVHKHGTLVDVLDEVVRSSDFTFGPPPEDVSAWAVSWSTSLRPPHLGLNEVCARAEREPGRFANDLRSFTVVDRIPPSNVPGLTFGDITPSSAKASWGAATDNYGLAGYEVTVDGGSAHRTTIGTRSFTITGLEPSSRHTVSVVAVDLAGNRSATPATASFTTEAEPTPTGGELTFDAREGGATALWHPDLPTEATFRAFLDGQPLDDIPLEQYCQDESGNPASPCTSQDVISYPIDALEDGTPYTFRVDALRADGTTARTLSGSFTTKTTPDAVPPETTQLTASESSRCAGVGGDIYLAASARAGVPVPAGSTELFEGCLNVPDTSCIDDVLPPSGDQAIKCSDDVTEFLVAAAPPGRGPVISSVDDLGGAVRTQQTELLTEPITWCVQNEACAIVVTTAPEAAPLVLEAAAIAAAVPTAVAVSFLVVVAAGIILGVAVGTLLAILFPGRIGFAGFVEYPIDFDVDFNTFEKWTLDEGEWINDLKIYAEVIKTTTLLTGRHGLPFAWNDRESQRLKRLIDKACTVQQGASASAGCGDGFAVYVPGGRNYKLEPLNETGTHIVTAMGGDDPFPFPQPERNPWFYPARSVNGAAATAAGFDRKWYYKSAFAADNPCMPRQSGRTCDEFPFWATNQAVTLSGVRADLQPVPNKESRPQATDISGFYGKCKVKDTDRFLVLPVQTWVAANGPSFGFRVTPGGADVCMEPDAP